MIGTLFYLLSNSYNLIYFRFYDELDYERRVRKRRTKLLSSCEDSFTHVRKCLHEKYGSHVPMDAREAAQVILHFINQHFLKIFF